MKGRVSDGPPVTGAAKQRAERLGAALRANLQRRKQQARARNEAGAEPPADDEGQAGAPDPKEQKR